MRKSLVALLLLAASGLAQAQVDLREGHPDRYTVVRIPVGHLGEIPPPAMEVAGTLARQPADPESHLIYPGDTLSLVYVDGQPRLVLNRGESRGTIKTSREIPPPAMEVAGTLARQPADPESPPDLPGDTLSLVYVDGQPRLVLNRGESRGTIKLSPKIRSTPIAEAIPTIPLDKINSFLLANRIVDDEKTFTSAPYIVAGNAERIVSGTGDRIYARGKFADGQPAYGIFRQGKVYIDPKTKEVLGINADDIGGGEVVATEGDVATLALTRTTQEVRLGDRLFPTEERAVNSTFMPGEPSREVKGEIIDVPRGVTQIGQFDVVTLNRGQRDGLAEGNVLAIYKVGETVRDRVTGESVKIPDERAGLLMVFRTYKKLSYALVLMASRPLSVTDRVQNPDSKPRLGGVSRSGEGNFIRRFPGSKPDPSPLPVSDGPACYG